MAITYTDNGGGAPNGSDLEFTYSFPVLQTEDVKVALNGVTQATTKYAVDTASNPTKITFNATSIDSALQETTTGNGKVAGAPKSGVSVRVYRRTTVGKTSGDDDPKAVFAAGSSIRAVDLNANTEQGLYAIHELQTQPRLAEDIADDSILSSHIKDGEIVDADINASADIANTKIADGLLKAGLTINSANIVNGSIVDEDINATANIQGSKLANDSVDLTKLGSGSLPTDITVSSTNIVNGTIVDADVNVSANIQGSKLLNDSVTLDKLGAGALPTDITIASANVVDGSIVDADIATGTLDNRYYTKSDLDGGQLDNRYYTEVQLNPLATNPGDNVLDARYFTETESDTRYFRQDSTETIASGDTWSGSDLKIATTGAIDLRVIDLIDDVGGFVPIANETSFPTSNPDVNNGTGTIVSITAASTNLVPSGTTVTIANGRGSGLPVVITNVPETIPSGYGFLVETKTTAHEYTFHRLVPKATEVSTVAANAVNIAAAGANVTDIHNFADLYQISTSAPTQRADSSNLVAGDLWYDSSSNKVLMIYDGSSGDGFTAATPNASDLANIAIVAGQITFTEDLGLITNAVATATGNTTLNTVAGIATEAATVAGIASDVTAVAADATDIGVVAGKATEIGRLGTADAVADMNTLGTTAIVSDMDTLADIPSDITTVAGISSNVTAVAGNATNINAVNANSTNINAVNTNSSNINTVSGINADVTTVAGISSNVTAVAGNASNINAAVSNATDISAVAGNNSNITAVANNSSNINSAVSNETNINSAVSNASNINSAVSNASNINTVAGNNANVTTVAGSIANVNTVSSNIGNVNIAASNVTDINSFANLYRIASSDPGSNNDEGDLYFNTTSNELRVYNGSTWQGGVTATGNLAGLGANTFTGAQTFASGQTFDGRDVSADGAKLDAITTSSGAILNGVTATTQSASDNSTKIATTAYTDTAIANLVDSSPNALNTLNELAAAIGDDANFSTTITNSIATKLPLAGGQMTGNITFSGSQTVDGRDLSADGAKLDGIAAGATNVSNTNQLTNGAGFITSSSNISGNAATATKLATARNIAGVAFDGTSSISLNNNDIINGAGYITSADGGNAATLDGIDSSQFVRSDANDSLGGLYDFTNAGNYPITISSTNNAKLLLSGSSSPYIRFREGSTDKAFIQWHSSGYLQLRNSEDGSGIQIKDDIRFTTDDFSSTSYKMWHAGNDGSGSGLDADTLDGVQASGFVAVGGDTMTGTLQSQHIQLAANTQLIRSDHHSGHLEGSYNNVGANADKSNPIYTIGYNYNPTDAALSNMYGIGFSHGNASFIPSGAGWGMYVAADGDSRVYLDGSNGRIYMGSYTAGRYLSDAQGDYGSVQINGSGRNNWEGYSIDGRAVFMHDGNATTGIYNDVNNEWMVHCTHNGAVTLYNNGSERIQATSSGASITGSLSVSSGASIGGNVTTNVYGRYFGKGSGDYIKFNSGYVSLAVSGTEDFRFESDGDFHADGNVTAYSTTVSSDRRLKENIKVVPNALDKVQALNGVTFDWKKDNTPSAGVIAQDVIEVLPEAVKEVTPAKGGESHLAVNYHALTSILIESIKELKAEVEELKGAK